MNLSTAIPIAITPRPILPNLGQKPPNSGKCISLYRYIYQRIQGKKSEPKLSSIVKNGNLEHIELLNIYRGKTFKGILFAVKNLGSKFSSILTLSRVHKVPFEPKIVQINGSHLSFFAQ